jgi:hypothetical protein
MLGYGINEVSFFLNCLRSDVLVSVKSRINVLSKSIIGIGSIKNAQKMGIKIRESLSPNV